MTAPAVFFYVKKNNFRKILRKIFQKSAFLHIIYLRYMYIICSQAAIFFFFFFSYAYT